MKLEDIALIGILIISGVGVLFYGALIVLGAIATFPFGLPVLALGGIFVFVFLGVVLQRMNNKEDDYYEKNIKE